MFLYYLKTAYNFISSTLLSMAMLYGRFAKHPPVMVVNNSSRESILLPPEVVAQFESKSSSCDFTKEVCGI